MKGENMECLIEYCGKRKFKAGMNGFEVITDLPERVGGEDSAMSPTQLFISSIGACMGLYAVRYLKTAGLDPSGLSVRLDWDFSDDKTRVGRIDATIKVPNAELGARKKAVIAAAKKCTLHGTLKEAPEMNTVIEE